MHGKQLAALAILLAAAATTAGCSDPTRPEGEVGSVSFEYEGAESGSFSVVGARPDNWAEEPHAAGERTDAPGYTKVFALTRDAQLWIAGDVAADGTYPIRAESGSPEEPVFAGELALGVDPGSNTARVVFVLTAGFVILEPAPAGRIRGRFAGTARALTGTATITITDGRFDVPANLPGPVD